MYPQVAGDQGDGGLGKFWNCQLQGQQRLLGLV